MASGSAIPVPPSFVALHLKPGRSKPLASWEEISERHEFCDDLAQMLMDRARHTQWDLGIDEEAVLQGMRRALTAAEQPVVSMPEAQWVVCRLAELLGWPMPEPEPSPGAEAPP